jgi:hypothetical protein
LTISTRASASPASAVSFFMSADVIAQPGAPDLSRCVRGTECPPRRATTERSTPKVPVSQAMADAELDVSAVMRVGRARSAPAEAAVSA